MTYRFSKADDAAEIRLELLRAHNHLLHPSEESFDFYGTTEVLDGERKPLKRGQCMGSPGFDRFPGRDRLLSHRTVGMLLRHVGDLSARQFGGRGFRHDLQSTVHPFLLGQGELRTDTIE